MRESAYRKSAFRPLEIPHRYGEHVHLLDDPLAWTLLARAGAPKVGQPEVGRLVRTLYERLVHVVIAAELPRELVSTKTRMVTHHPAEGVYRGLSVAAGTKVVTVGIARAGTMPSQITYEMLTSVLEPDGVRQDHLFMSRVTNTNGEVTGVDWHDAKIGREVEGRFIFFPDPMGATGSSMVSAIQHYQERLDGKPERCIAIHLIVTPEYLKRVQTDAPDARVYALRLDRGLSPPEVLGLVPGERWSEERGLNDRQYIVPGAGGIGEVLNNAWV